MYHKYRTDYSAESIAAVVARARLDGTQIVADLGAGTGLLTRHLREHARRVFAIEPASDMRALIDIDAIDGTAEATTLPAASIDVIASGNAFHYFDPMRTRVEARRILRRGGRVVVLFHDPIITPFMREFIALMERRSPIDLGAVHTTDDHESRLAAFFEDRETAVDSGEQEERLDWNQLRGRYLSSSRANENALGDLRNLFDRHQDHGAVTLRLIWKCVSCDSF